MKHAVIDATGKTTGQMDLPESVFSAKERPDLVHEVVTALMANRRAGSAATKNRALVHGGGRKPWRQKGTGRARQGSIRAPQWVGGGTVFGPSPRKYVKHLPKKMRRTALLSILSHRANNGNMTILDDFQMEEYKTNRVVQLMKDLKVLDKGNILLVVDGFQEKLFVSSSNLPYVDACAVSRLNAYDVASHDHLIITKSSVQKLAEVYAE
jgi:large subunit ribosomal protein L4